MADWRIIAVVLVGLFLITVGLFTEAGTNPDGFAGQMGEALRRGFSLEMLSQEKDNITLSGTFWLNELDLKTISIEKIRIGYDPQIQDSNILISDTKLATDTYTEIELSGYDGTFLINNSRLSLLGNVEGDTVNGVKFETVKKSIPVNMQSVLFRNIYIDDFYIKNLEIKATGDLKVQDKVSLELGLEPLKLENFRGSLNVTEDGIEINGTANKIFVSGNDYTATFI